ncbi:MAG: hypothetical protein ACFE9Q_04250 [Candidatus Hodarchaeota archaeon]
MKNTKLSVFILIFSIGFLFTNISIPQGLSIANLGKIPESCTIFTAAIGDKVFFGNNEDFLLDGTYMWFFPSQEIEIPNGTLLTHGSIFFGFDNNYNHPADGRVMGGMNDQGLCFDINGLSDIIKLNLYPEREEIYSWALGNEGLQVLWECSTVNDTIEWFESHHPYSYIAWQIHFADATGDAVVISGGDDGELVYTRKGNSTYLISTNFNVANFSSWPHECWRYDTAKSYLEALSDEESLTVDYCRDILDAVSTSETSYSNIFDPIQFDIYVYYEHRYSKVIKLNLEEELANITTGINGEPTTLGDMLSYWGEFTLKAIRIADLFQTDYSWNYYPDTPEPSSLNPWLLIPLILGITGLVIGSVVGVIYGSKHLIRYFKKLRMK